MKKIVSTIFVAMLCFVITATAQVRTVTGRVTDDKGNPIPSASIVVKGNNTGAAADGNGNFKVNAKTGDVLVITAVNFQSRNFKVTQGSDFKITLVSAVNDLAEVVVTTAGGIKTRKKEIGTANTELKGEAIVAGKAVNVASGLQGKVAGLQISGTGGGVNPSFRMVLRGQRSLTGNNQALIVLDNVIVPNDLLGNLNPEDIEDVVVLNGAGAAALYGSQASNGAIIVSTKKGKKGKAIISLSNTVTMQQVAFFPKIQDQFGAGGTGYSTDINGKPEFSYLENQSYGPRFDGVKRPLGPPLADGSQDSAYYSFNPGHNKFWEIGVADQTDFAISSGDDNSTAYFSAQYLKATGVTPGDNYNRASIRLNATRRVSNKININYNVAYIQNRYDITSATGSMYGNMLNMPSNVDITKYKNWRTDPFANPNGFYNPWYQNPYFTADNYRSYTRNDYLTGNIEIKYAPFSGLEIVGRQGISTRNVSTKNTTGGFVFTDYAKHTDASSKSDIAASVSDGSSFTTQLVTDLYAQYHTSKGDFDYKIIGGAQLRQDQAKAVGVSATGLVVPGLFNVSNGVGTPGASESNYLARQYGLYADGRIGYKNYLFLHGTVRNDWVSILNPDNRSFFYPSVDLSFAASDALEFIKKSNTISYLKFRGGWSKVGQVNLGGTFGAYQLLPTFSSGAAGFPYGSLAGYTVDNILVAPSLKPEITKGYEVGFDLNMFKNRLVTNVTYYSTKTDDQTVTTSLSNSTGFSALRTNTGQTSSKGLEVSAHYTAVRTRDLTVTVGGNYTYLDNNVNFISSDLPRIGLATYGSTAGSYAVAGQQFPVIMGYDYKRTTDGHVIVDRLTGLPTKSDTISILGSGVAKNRLSIDGSIRYKNFTLSFLFEYRGGYQVFNAMGPEMDWSGTGYRTALFNRERFVFPNSVIADPANPGKYITNTDITVKNGNGNNGFWTDGINRDITSNYVTSGDFWKLREISLAYDVPASWLAKTKVFKGATISVQGRNLFMWMAKDNYYTDPEYSDAGNDSNGIGLTSLNSAPPSRYFGGTISFKF